MIVSTVGPDMDFLFQLAGLGHLDFAHRAFTHSFVGGAAWGLVLAAGFRLAARRAAPFSLYALAAALGSWVHILGDWATSYGTPILWPFSRRQFSLDLIGNLDLYFGVGLGLALIAASQLARHGRVSLAVRIRWGTLVGACVYLGMLFWARQAALRDGGAAAFPAFESPLVRRVVYPERDGSYRLVWNNVVTGTRRERRLGMRPDPQDPAVQAVRDTPPVKRFLRHARFPVVKTVRGADGAVTVWWTDLLFVRGGWLAGSLFVKQDPRGVVTESGWAQEFW